MKVAARASSSSTLIRQVTANMLLKLEMVFRRPLDWWRVCTTIAAILGDTKVSANFLLVVKSLFSPLLVLSHFRYLLFHRYAYVIVWVLQKSHLGKGKVRH